MEFLAEVGVKISAEVGVKISAEVGVKISAEVGVKISAEVGVKITAEVGVKISAEVGVKISAEVGVKISAEVGVKISAEVGVKISAEVGVKTSRVLALSPYLQMELRQTNAVSVFLIIVHISEVTKFLVNFQFQRLLIPARNSKRTRTEDFDGKTRSVNIMTDQKQITDLLNN